MNLKRAWLAIPVVAALSLAACSGGGSNSDGQSGDAAVASGDAITASGTEPQNPLIPANTNEVGGGRILDLLFAGLVYYDESGQTQMDVAESIDSTDSKVWTVKIKPDQKFSDGTPVTAASFVDAWKLGSKDKMLSMTFYEPIEGTDDEGAGDLDGLKVVDDTTFTITLKQAEADFPTRLGYSAFAPLPQSTLDDIENGGEHPIGNGPYMMAGDDAWVHNEKVSLVPNPEYNGPRKAQNAGVDFVFYTTPEAEYNDLQAGNLDVMDQIPDSAVATFQDELGERAINQASATNQTLTIPEYMDHFSGDEGKLRRQAISMAINRAEITDKIFNGTREPAKDFTSPVVTGYAQDLPGSEVLNFDADKAKELWKQADEISPWSGKFDISYNADGPHKAWVDAVANQIKNNLGIDAVSNSYPDFKSLRDDVTNRKMTGAFRTGWQADYPSAYNFLAPLYMTGGGSNDGDYSSAAFDEALDKAAAAPDAEKMTDELSKAQEILFQDMPTIPLWYQNAIGGTSDKVENVTFGWNSVPLYYQITKK